MSDRSLWQAVMTWVSGGSSFVTFCTTIALLVVISTAVRRHRPDAYQGLQLWAIGSLVAHVVMTIARTAVPFLAMRDGGVESFMKWNAALTGVGVAIHLVLVIVLMRGLVALAQPPKPLSVEGAPPYR